MLQKIVASQKNQHILLHIASHHMLLLSFVSSCKVVTKDSSIPEKPTHVATIFCPAWSALQRVRRCEIRCALAGHTTRARFAARSAQPPRREATTRERSPTRPRSGAAQRATAARTASARTDSDNHLAKLLQKIVASQKNQHILLHIASHVATIFCNHPAKLLQKMITLSNSVGDSFKKGW